MIGKKLTKREFAILIVCILTFFVYISFNWLIKPMVNRIEIVEKKVMIGQKRLNKAKRTIKKSKQIDRQYENLIDQFKQTTPDEQVMSSILAEIEEVANNLNLNISNLKPQKVKLEDYYSRFSVSLTLNGDFVTIVHFIHRLQDQPHLFDVEQVSFEKGARKKSAAIKTRLVLNRKLIPSE